MSSNQKFIQCYKVIKKDERYHLYDNGENEDFTNDLLIPIKSWKQTRGLYNYLVKQHKKCSYHRDDLRKMVQDSLKVVHPSANGVFF